MDFENKTRDEVEHFLRNGTKYERVLDGTPVVRWYTGNELTSKSDLPLGNLQSTAAMFDTFDKYCERDVELSGTQHEPGGRWLTWGTWNITPTTEGGPDTVSIEYRSKYRRDSVMVNMSNVMRAAERLYMLGAHPHDLHLVAEALGNVRSHEHAMREMDMQHERGEGVCRHGTYVGGCGIDWMCGDCEMDADD